jgi:hypothetical protein
MHVKMTRIESGATVPKALFTFYMNVKIVTAKLFGRHSTKLGSGTEY